MTTLEYSLSIPWNWISAHFQQIFNPSLSMPLSRRHKVSIPGCKAIMKVCHMFEYVLHILTLPDQTRGSNQSCSSAGLQKTYRIHDRLQSSKYYYTLWRCALENWLQDPFLQNLFQVIPRHTQWKVLYYNFHNPPTIEFLNSYAYPIQGILHLTTKQDLNAHSPTSRCVVADPTLLQRADLYDCKARSFKKLKPISPHFHQLSATSLKELSEVKFNSKRLNIHVPSD